MPKSRNRKNHKAKVASRNSKIEQQKKRVDKLQKDFLMNLIKKEQESGLFDNNPSIEPLSSNTTKLDIEGPII